MSEHPNDVEETPGLEVYQALGRGLFDAIRSIERSPWTRSTSYPVRSATGMFTVNVSRAGAEPVTEADHAKVAATRTLEAGIIRQQDDRIKALEQQVDSLIRVLERSA